MLTAFFAFWFLLGLIALGLTILWAIQNEKVGLIDETQGYLRLKDDAQPPAAAKKRQARQRRAQRSGPAG